MAVKINRGGNVLDRVKGIVVTPRSATNTPLTSTFLFSGFNQYVTVPAGITQMHATVVGASGANTATDGSTGGLGRIVTGLINVTPGEILQVIAAGNGDTGRGFGGGGQGTGIWGGGASDIRRAPYALADRLIIGAGGGGRFNGVAGNGGNPNGTTGTGDSGQGQGGTTTAGGAHGTTSAAGQDGSLGFGGDGTNAGQGASGAGGGGLYGGGGGGSGALNTGNGGGGSSLLPAGGAFGGLSWGHGYVILRWGGALNQVSPFRTWFQDAQPVGPSLGDFWLPKSGLGGPTFRSATVVNNTLASPIVMAKPAGAVAGDMLFLVATSRGSATPDASWDPAVPIIAGDDASSPGRYVWSRRVLAGDGASYSIPHGSTGSSITFVLLCYSNVGSYVAASVALGNSLWTPVNGFFPEVTPTSISAVVLALVMGNSGNNASPPSAAFGAPFTTRVNATGVHRLGVVAADALANQETRQTTLGATFTQAGMDYGVSLLLYPSFTPTGVAIQRWNGTSWQPYTIGT